MITEEDYVEKRKTWLDRVLFYSYLLPLIAFILVSIAVYNGSYEGERFFGVTFVITFLVAVACRMIRSARIDGYMREFRRNKPNA